MNFTFRDIVWVGVITLVIVLLSKCHRDNSHELAAHIKQLQDKANKDSLSISDQLAIYQAKVTEAQSNANLYINKSKLIEQDLDKKSATVLRLAAALMAANIPDTNVIDVGQEYLDYCDSLALESSNLAVSFGAYKKNNSYILSAKNAEIIAKDSIIAIEHNGRLTCKSDYNALMHYYQASQKAMIPRNQVYIGAELMANPASLISNVGMAITVKTKFNKLWQLSGGIQTNGQYYARVNGNILIRLKK